MNRLLRWSLAVLIVGFWGLPLSGVFGNRGILQAYRLSEARRDLSIRLNALERERDYLKNQIQLLESDEWTQEKTVREILGYTRRGELVFDFRDPRSRQ